jgi:hypothetical protein
VVLLALAAVSVWWLLRAAAQREAGIAVENPDCTD